MAVQPLESPVAAVDAALSIITAIDVETDVAAVG